jgi:AraC-like DNA-binding protein/CheY-like chemotaxis protein
MVRPKILIVEDEIIIAEDISLILEDEGYETQIGIITVKEAIKAIEENEYVMVLIDINLSNNSDGVELGAYLLKKDTVPFVYITSYSDNVTLNRLKDTRPHGIIIKPFKPIDIKSTVSVILNNYKYKNIDVFRKEISINEHNVDDVPFILKNVIEYINLNINLKIDTIELSKLTKWSHHHFIKNFTKYIKQTPYQYILKKKIEKAKAIMIETNESLSDIASDLGFKSYSNFCIAFKKETNKTPDAYRKLYYLKKQIK